MAKSRLPKVAALGLSRLIVGVLFAGVLSMPAASLAKPSCPAVMLPVTHHRQAGPTCVVAATLTAISARVTSKTPATEDRLKSRPTEVSTLRRHLPMWPDGVDPYDLLVEMKRRDFDGLAFMGPPEAAARLVEAGFGVVALFKSKTTRHAVAVTGIRRRSAGKSGCSTALRALRVHDPAKSSGHWLTAKQFAARQSAHQMLVFFKPSESVQIKSTGFPLQVAQRADRRFRAQAVFRRAKLHKKPNRQVISLLKQSVQYDPCFKPARDELHRVEHHLNVSHLHLPECADQ